MPQEPTIWTRGTVHAPHLANGIDVIVARGVATLEGGHRLQTMNLYLPATAENAEVVGTPITTLAFAAADAVAPWLQVHVHGGAWRDPMTDAQSIEAAVACAFADPEAALPIRAIASINYTLTQFPLHPVAPYDAIKDKPKDPAREAVHPQHVQDVYRGLAALGRLGVGDRDYLMSGHSAGSGLVMQTSLMAPSYWGLGGDEEIPAPAAVIGLNGLYDLPALVHDLDEEHALTGNDYRIMLFNAFGPDERRWADASPAHFDPATISKRAADGRAPKLVLLDQSIDDQLVPLNQRQHLEAVLRQASDVELAVGHRCTGKHSEPWISGHMIWNSVQDALTRLAR